MPDTARPTPTTPRTLWGLLLALAAGLLGLAAFGILPGGWPQAAPIDPDLLLGLVAALAAGLLSSRPGRPGWRERLQRDRRWLADAGLVLLLCFDSLGIGRLVTLLSPQVCDPLLAAIDARLVPGLDLAGLLAQPAGHLLAWLAAAGPALGIAVLALLGRPESRPLRARLLVALVLAGVLGWAVWLLVPAVGPAAWAERPPLPAGQVASGEPAADPRPAPQPLAAPVPRDAFPPLSLTWALLALAAVGPRRRIARGALLAGVAGVGLATLLGGRTGPAGLLAAGALALTAWPLAGWLLRPAGGPRPGAGRDLAIVLLAPVALGLGLSLLWRRGLLGAVSAWAWITASLALAIRSGRRLTRRLGSAPAAGRSAPAGGGPLGRRLLQVLGLFFCSGLTGLIYEVVFERQLALIFGSTARATTTVLAVYMSGLALGAFLGGRLADRVRRPLRFYALAEALVGALCLLAPGLFGLANRAYLGLVEGLALAPALEALIQAGCCSVVVLLPALLMGTTLPFLARHATSELERLKRNVALLYSANTLGAAVGSLLAAYWLVAALGIDGALRLATVVNFSVAGIAWWLAARVSPAGGPGGPAARRWGGRFGIGLVIAAFAVGFISFGLEVLWVHLLAVVAGNSVYAFGLMLFSFLCGLGLGSLGLARWRIAAALRPARLAATVLALGASILVLLPLWDHIPPFFGRYSQVAFADTFARREFIRFAVCFGMMIVPTVLIGMIFPQLVDLSTRSVDALGRHVGLVSFANTLGNIAGAVITGLVLLPGFGSFQTSRLLGALALLLGAGLALAAAGRMRWSLAGFGLGACALLLAGLPGRWNPTTLTLGTNVYFSYQPYGRTVEMREGIDGGISSVARAERHGRLVTTLLTNGKFQGDDHGEMLAQSRFALYPLLHCPARDRALVIGLGTGVTAGVLARAGFGRIEIAELSADLLALARRWFGGINEGVLDDPRTRIFVTDGRNLLAVRDQRYDLISMEVSSIWFAGAANLYNREFYELVRRRLRPAGVLQQWVQLHHISPTDVASILVTLRSVFDHVALYWGGDQGVLVASARPLVLDAGYLARLEADPALAEVRRRMPWDSFWPLAGELLMDTRAIDAFVAAAAEAEGLLPGALISTDSNRRLEYSTPRGNLRPHGRRALIALLRRFQGPGPSRLPVKPAPGTAALLAGARLLGGPSPTAARALLQQATASERTDVRATAERLLARLADRR